MKGSSLRLLACLLFLLVPALAFGADTIKIGFNLEMTGDNPEIGQSSRNAAELLKEEINSKGGLAVGDKKYQLEFIYQDNEFKPDQARSAQIKLIEQDKVLAIVGPQASKQAIPSGEIADEKSTPMISPWSTNPATTLDRPYVFRACFLDPFQAPVAANFAAKTFKAKTAAVLFDLSDDYAKGLAENFRDYFVKKFGADSVVAFESHGNKDRDFSGQLTKIIAAKPDFIFVPNHYSQVALIVKQARDLGYKNPFMGSDSWGGGGPELLTLCGDLCKGQYFSTHFASAGAKGATKEFIDKYKAKFNTVPGDPAALAWDATRLVLQAIQKVGKLSGDVKKDREAIQKAMASTKEFDGITGKMTYTPGSGDPAKCAVVVKISDKGEYEFADSVCP